MLGIQLRLCKDHIASETALRSRCSCSQDASAYPAKGSFPSLVLKAFSKKRGYCSVKPILRCNTPVLFTYNRSWSTACWSCWNGSRFYYNKIKLHYFLGIQYAIINLPYVLINTSFMCELTLNGLSVHYTVDHSVPCQLWCLVAFGIYGIFPNFLTLLLVLVREMKHKKFFLLGIVCDLSRSRIFKCQCNLEKSEEKVLEMRILCHWGCCRDWSLQCLEKGWYFFWSALLFWSWKLAFISPNYRAIILNMMSQTVHCYTDGNLIRSHLVELNHS